MIAVVVLRRHRGWGRNFCRRRCSRLAGRLVDRRRGGRLVIAVRALNMLAARPMIIALRGLGASALVIAMRIVGGGRVVLAVPILGGRPVVATVCARWRRRSIGNPT